MAWLSSFPSKWCAPPDLAPRPYMQAKTCKNLPVQCIGLTLYDDDDVMGAHVTRTQWISPDCDLSGQAVLLVDEVDDSRKTLAFAAEEMLRYV